MAKFAFVAAQLTIPATITGIEDPFRTFARDGLARVEMAGDASSLGVRFEEDRIMGCSRRIIAKTLAPTVAAMEGKR